MPAPPAPDAKRQRPGSDHRSAAWKNTPRRRHNEAFPALRVADAGDIEAYRHWRFWDQLVRERPYTGAGWSW